MKCPNCKLTLVDLDLGKPTERKECFKCGFNVPLNTKSIDEFYCWLSVDEEGKEGMVGTERNGIHYVAQHSVKEMAQRLRPEMQNAADHTEMKMRLVRFLRAEIIEELK